MPRIRRDDSRNSSRKAQAEAPTKWYGVAFSQLFQCPWRSREPAHPIEKIKLQEWKISHSAEPHTVFFIIDYRYKISSYWRAKSDKMKQMTYTYYQTSFISMCRCQMYLRLSISLGLRNGTTLWSIIIILYNHIITTYITLYVLHRLPVSCMEYSG